MDTKILNTRKNEITLAMSDILTVAESAKRHTLSPDEQIAYTNFENELAGVNANITRYEALNKSKSELSTPREQMVIGNSDQKSKFKNCTNEYGTGFWKAMSSKNFSNAALGEGGTAADGSFLVPAQTLSTIPNLAVIEAAARKLSRVITTQMDIKIPYQASKTVAAAKAESNNSGVNAFAANVPTFAQTTLSAFTAGDYVTISWELMQDVGALAEFVTADLNRAVFNYEESKFISGSGSGEPLGYLNGATAFESAPLTINSILDLEASVKSAYYPNASFLFNRSEFNRLRKLQLAQNQFMGYITQDGVNFFLDGYPVLFSTAMPTFVASPEGNGAVLFGDFASGFTIGDRNSSDIRVQVLDQVQAVNGQTVILGYRRTDQRCVLQEAVQILTTNG